MAKTIQRLVLATVFATFLAGSSASLAFAADQPAPSPTAPNFGPKHHDEDREGEDDHHAEIHNKYGNDVDQVFLPPLVVKDAPTGSGGNTGKSNIKPGTSGISPLNTNTAPTKLKDAAAVDPASNLPVNPDSVAPTTQTPADKFFQVASFGLGVMAIGSVALGGIVVVQRIRQRS